MICFIRGCNTCVLFAAAGFVAFFYAEIEFFVARITIAAVSFARTSARNIIIAGIIVHRVFDATIAGII